MQVSIEPMPQFTNRGLIKPCPANKATRGRSTVFKLALPDRCHLNLRPSSRQTFDARRCTHLFDELGDFRCRHGLHRHWNHDTTDADRLRRPWFARKGLLTERRRKPV